jgi:hypothetical protein
MLLPLEESNLLAWAAHNGGVLTVPDLLLDEPALIDLCEKGLLAVAWGDSSPEFVTFVLTTAGVRYAVPVN